MSRVVLCPRCEIEVRFETLDADGLVVCPFCEKPFAPSKPLPEPVPTASPTSDAELPVAEVVRLPASPKPAPTPAKIGDWGESEEELDAIPVLPPQPWAPPRVGPRRLLEPEDNPWWDFSRASRLVCIGMATELILLVIMLTMFLVFASMSSDTRPVRNAKPEIADIRTILIFLCGGGMVIASGLIAAGRTGQASIPGNRMGTAASSAVALVGWVQFLAVVCGVAAMAMSFAGWTSKNTVKTDQFAHLAGLACIIALFARWIADSGTIINLALVSGVLPSRSLRDRVGSVNLVCQIIGMVYMLLFVAAYSKEFDPPLRRINPGDSFIAMAFVLIVFLVLMLLYALMNIGLHASAYYAAREWRPNQPD